MFTFSIDLELTNRCNASCHFCPRDRTPDQGMMSPETFARALERAVEYRDEVALALAPDETLVEVSLCGLGEPLLNKHAADFVRQVKAAGFACSLSSNGALLDERRGTAVLDAGLDVIYLNIGDIGESYEEVYKLPFEKTRDQIVAFAEQAKGRCEVCIVLVNYKADQDHIQAMREYWQAYGIETFQDFEIINRGGSLFVDHMQYEAFPELQEARAMLHRDGDIPLCGAPYAYMFVGYDANYYLCCSDWEKRAPLGSVFDVSFLDVVGAKLEHTVDRQAVCRTCNLDPINKMTEALQEAAVTGDREAVASLDASIRSGSRAIASALERMRPGSTAAMHDRAPGRARIPLIVEG